MFRHARELRSYCVLLRRLPKVCFLAVRRRGRGASNIAYAGVGVACSRMWIEDPNLNYPTVCEKTSRAENGSKVTPRDKRQD